MAYPIKQLWASSETYTQGRASVDWIVVHYTATQASAENNCKYFSGGNRNASAHYFIDGSGTIWQSVAEEDTAWHAGNWYMNTRSIGIEVVSDGRDFSQAEKDELKWLVGKLMTAYGLDADHIIRHYDVAKHAQGSTVDPYKRCPAPYVDTGKWGSLHSYITSREGWVKDPKGWWWRNADGTWPASTWKKIGGKWYYFKEDGYMHTGWFYDTGKWYWLTENGDMVADCMNEIGGYTYGFTKSGAMVTSSKQLEVADWGAIWPRS